MARRSLKPQLNQIRTWVRQGRTDAWVAHQLDVSVKDIAAFKREHELEAGETAGGESDLFGPTVHEDEPDLRAEDEALVAAALEADLAATDEDDDDEDEGDSGREGESDADSEEGDDKPRRRRRGRRGGRGRSGSRGGGRSGKPLEGSFDHGEEGYGLWLDPAVRDNPVYAEHWAGHRPVTVAIEADRIVITRAGDSDGDSSSS
ncbi:MAG: hypothetical protein ACR2GL_01380 [Thermoleophilaceae bacterium]